MSRFLGLGLIVALGFLVLVPVSRAGVVTGEEIIDGLAITMRGDVDHSGGVNISDPTYLSSFLFSGGPQPPCMNEADANHDGAVNVADVSFLLSWLFGQGTAPPAPGAYNTTCTTTYPSISCDIGCD